MTEDVYIVGVGLSSFARDAAQPARARALQAIAAALADAGVSWADVQLAVGGSDAAGLADTLVTDLGLTGTPFMNVKNGCATGGSALTSAMYAVRSGAARLALAVGFDEHPPGAFAARPEEWGLPAGYGSEGLMVTTQFFGAKIARYMHDFGITSGALAAVAEKAYRNGSLNPRAWRRDPRSAEEILAAPMVNDPLTKLMFCTPGQGGAAVLLADAATGARIGGAVRIRAVALRTRPFGTFEVFAPWVAGGEVSSVTREAAAAAFEESGVGPHDIDVVQVQDTESGAEVMHLAECGFCEDGEQEKLILEGETEIGGRLPVNTDGGCLANGEPIGASGLRQVIEVTEQLRGRAGERQVAGTPRLGFTHVYGAPGVSACTVLEAAR